MEREFDLFLWAEGEGTQELQVFGSKIRAVFGKIVNLVVCNANIGKLGDLGLKPVVGLAIQLEFGGTIGEPVSDLCVRCQQPAVLALSS